MGSPLPPPFSANPKKTCLLVGFNLGSACQLLANVCVLYRNCYNFDTTCGTVRFFSVGMERYPLTRPYDLSVMCD